MPKKSFIFLPYLILKDWNYIPVSGRFKLVDIDSIKTIDNSVTDDQIYWIKRQVNRYNTGKNPPKKFTVLTIDDRVLFESLDNKTRNDFSVIKTSIFLSLLSAMNVSHLGVINAGHHAITSDNCFITGERLVEKEDEFVSSVTGSIIEKAEGFDFLSYEKEMAITTPIYLSNPFFSTEYDFELTRALLQLSRRKKRALRRIRLATEFFRRAYTNDEKIGEHERILLQVMAIEILLDIISPDMQRKSLKDEFDTLFATKKVNAKYKSERKVTARNPSGHVIDRARRQTMWIDTIYMLRNHIIHGQIIPRKEFYFNHQRHFDLATQFFIVLLKKKLNEYLGKTIFSADIDWKLIKEHESTAMGFVTNNK